MHEGYGVKLIAPTFAFLRRNIETACHDFRDLGKETTERTLPIPSLSTLNDLKVSIKDSVHSLPLRDKLSYKPVLSSPSVVWQ